MKGVNVVDPERVARRATQSRAARSVARRSSLV